MKSAIRNSGLIVAVFFSFAIQAAPGKTFFDKPETGGINQVQFSAKSFNDIPVKSAWVKKEVAISWQTITEVNTRYFELQRSYNGKNYETIGLIKAVGNAKNAATYGFIDFKNENRRGQSYYRLKTVFEDGTEAYTIGTKTKKTGVFDANQSYATAAGLVVEKQ
jgi:uncharacterized protein YfdQ (DUF2303 family)